MFLLILKPFKVSELTLGRREQSLPPITPDSGFASEGGDIMAHMNLLTPISKPDTT